MNSDLIPHSRPWLTKEDFIKINEILESGLIATGDKVIDFENSLNKYFRTKNSVVTSSGTNALIMALKILEVNKNDEVILPSYVCDSVIESVRICGATPVICDIGAYWNMTLENTEKFISKKTKAIILVHQFGIALNTKEFKTFNLPIIEDCCQSFGANYKNKKVGTIGDLGVFSFNATKCLTTGYGGALISNSNELLERINEIKNDCKNLSLMTDIQAALGLSQLSRYEKFLELRYSMANKYLENLPFDLINKINSIKKNSIFYRFLINTSNSLNFDTLKRYYSKEGISIRRGVDDLLHRKNNISDKYYLNSVKCFDHTLSIPIYPSLSKEEQDKIIEVTNSFYMKGILK